MQELNDRKTARTRSSRKVGLLLLGTAVIVIAAVAVWMSPVNGGGDFDHGLVRTETGNPGTVGTSGMANESQGPGEAAGNAIRELSTITGVNDGHQLVGRPVALSAPVSQHINDIAFWIGEGDNRLLVVLVRDDRNDPDRSNGGIAETGLGRLGVGQQAAIAGSIQRVPYSEALDRWGLTSNDRAELMERRVYLRAETVTPIAD
jgi:hypothetical protein